MKFNKILYFNLILFILAAILVFVVGFFVVSTTQEISAATDDEEDTTPPQVFNIKVATTTATSTIVSWETNEEADSMINYGLDKSYGILRNPRFDKFKHELILEELMPDTQYYFRITSSDASGNQGISSDYSFITDKQEETLDEGGEESKMTNEIMEELLELLQNAASGEDAAELEQIDELDPGALGKILEMLKKLSESDLADMINEGKTEDKLDGGIDENEYLALEEVLNMLEAISSEEALEMVEEELQDRAEDVLLPPTIILDLADVEVGTDYAIISWQTDKESNSMVSLAEEEDFNPEAEDPYIWNEGESDEMVLDHVIEITGLKPATVYHFQVSSKSSLDLTGRSGDKTFKTKSILPEIENIQITKIEEDAATIRWTTNVPCSSIIEYTNLTNNETKLEGNSSFLTVHSMRLTNLVFDTYYSFVINVESEDEENAQSNPMTFITIRDKYPPEVSKVSTESTIYPGSDNKIQTIISWMTDEPAKCQLFYHQGLILADEPDALPIEEEYAAKHVEVITNFLPASVYKYWIVCADEADNSEKSDDFTMLTPTQEESIIDIIIKNFESQFSWMKKK